jgi:hypothetical protein
MKKIVSIAVTTGLLLGAVSFSALACGPEKGPGRLQDQKRVVRHERYQPPRELQRNQAQIIVKVKAKGKVPPPAPVSKVKRPGPGPEDGNRFMPKPVPERHGGRR